MVRQKDRLVGSIAQKVLGYLPNDGHGVYWKDIEEKALADGMSTRTLLKYTLLLEKAGVISKHLDPESRRPRYLYSRSKEGYWQRREEERAEILNIIKEEASEIKNVGSDEQCETIAALFSVMLTVISSTIAQVLSDYASYRKKEDADTFLDVNIELDIIPIIKELANALPHNPNTWKGAFQIYLDKDILPRLKEEMNISNDLFKELTLQDEERNS